MEKRFGTEWRNRVPPFMKNPNASPIPDLGLGLSKEANKDSVMEDLNGEDFKDITSYVPKFYIKPVVTNTSEDKVEVIPGNQSHIDEVSPFPSNNDWYIRPQRNVYPGEQFNRHESTSEMVTNIYDNLVDKLIKDHGWKLQDFDILKNKAKSVIYSMNGHNYKDNTEIEDNTCHSLKSTKRVVAPAYYIEGRQVQVRTGHAIVENVHGKFQNIMNTYNKTPEIYSETKGRVSYWSVQRDVTEFDTLHIKKSNHSILKYLQSYLGFCQWSLSYTNDKHMMKNFLNFPNESLEFKFDKSWDNSRRFSINNRYYYNTNKESEDSNNWTESVNNKNDLLSRSSFQNIDTFKEEGFNKNTVEYSVDKCFNTLSQARDLTNVTSSDMLQNLMKSPITTSQNLRDREVNIPSCKQHKYINTMPSPYIAQVCPRSNSHLKMNHKPPLKSTVTNNLYIKRRILRTHNWQHFTRNNLGMSRPTHKIENTVTCTSTETNCGEPSNKEVVTETTDSQLEQKMILTRELLYQIFRVLKQSREKAIKSKNYEIFNPNNDNVQTNTSSVLAFEPVPNNHANVEALEKNSIDGINSNLKILPVYLNNNEPEHLTSSTKRLSQNIANITDKETYRLPVRLLQSSVLHLMISEVSSTSLEDKNDLAIEKSDQSFSERLPTKSTNVEMTNCQSNSNIVISSNGFESMNKRSEKEWQEIELDEWALKYQLLSAIKQRKVNVKLKLDEKSQTTTISKPLLVSKEQRKYKNNIWIESKVHPSIQTDAYLYKQKIQNPYWIRIKNNPDKKFVSLTKKAELSDRMFEHSNSDAAPFGQSEIKYHSKHYQSKLNAEKVHLFKKPYYRTSEQSSINTKKQNSNFHKALPTVDKLLESLWHNHKIKRKRNHNNLIKPI